MGPSRAYHTPEGEECQTSVEHGSPLWAEPAVGYCSRRPHPSPMWGSRFVGARAVGPWVAEQKPLGKTTLRGNPSSEMTYLPTFSVYRLARGRLNSKTPAVATDRLLWPPPCVVTAFRVYGLPRRDWNNKTSAVATRSLLCARPCVCTAFRMYRLAYDPLNNKIPAPATHRLLCAPPCVCTAICVHRLVCESPHPPYPPVPPPCTSVM